MFGPRCTMPQVGRPIFIVSDIVCCERTAALGVPFFSIELYVWLLAAYDVVDCSSVPMQDMLTYDAASGCLNIPCLRQAGAWWRSWRQRTCGLTPGCQTCSSGWSSTSCPSAGGCCSKVADLQRRHMQTHLCVPLFACFAIRLFKPLVCVTSDGKYNTAQIGDVSVTWATSSVAWLVSIIILIFIIASAVCLCNVRLPLRCLA